MSCNGTDWRTPKFEGWKLYSGILFIRDPTWTGLGIILTYKSRSTRKKDLPPEIPHGLAWAGTWNIMENFDRVLYLEGVGFFPGGAQVDVVTSCKKRRLSLVSFLFLLAPYRRLVQAEAHFARLLIFAVAPAATGNYVRQFHLRTYFLFRRCLCSLPTCDVTVQSYGGSQCKNHLYLQYSSFWLKKNTFVNSRCL